MHVLICFGFWYSFDGCVCCLVCCGCFFFGGFLRFG